MRNLLYVIAHPSKALLFYMALGNPEVVFQCPELVLFEHFPRRQADRVLPRQG